jgi:hypothetical protein
VLRLILWGGLTIGVFASAAIAQQKNPPVRVNVLNVCAPSQQDQKELASALARIPLKPRWAEDFEVSRGRTSLPGSTGGEGSSPKVQVAPAASTWARIRREFSPESPFSNAQYSFSLDTNDMIETLVLNVRDPKDLLQISIEDRVSAVASPATVLATDTPAGRIKLEGFGKSSIVLARCDVAARGGSPSADQSAYEPLFRSASAVLTAYRNALGVRNSIPAELARVSKSSGASQAARKRKRARLIACP